MMSNEMQTVFLGPGRNPKRRKRYIDNQQPDVNGLLIIGLEWRELLTKCVKNGNNAQWKTWLKIAGAARKTTLEHLLKWLLQNGWVCVYEEIYSGGWWPYKIELLHIDELRTGLGLTNPNLQKERWLNLREQLLELENQLPNLSEAVNKLDEMSVVRAINRAELALALVRWIEEGREGTYRDFSLYARDETKQITKAEWEWLDNCFDLNEHQIAPHTPILFISGSSDLVSNFGSLSLGCYPDFAALTPSVIDSIYKIKSAPDLWIVIENRTCFERVAKSRNLNQNVIWVPGYAPSWWKKAIKHLLGLAPAPLRIACDLDPAGIEIAQQVIMMWGERNLPIDDSLMSPMYFAKVKKPLPLTNADKHIAQRLNQKYLTEGLKTLLKDMVSNNRKAEQENYL